MVVVVVVACKQLNTSTMGFVDCFVLHYLFSIFRDPMINYIVIFLILGERIRIRRQAFFTQ